MKALVGFEESLTVTRELRAIGVEAYSNDIQETSGSNSEWHLQGCFFDALYLDKWDIVIIHPPCTYTCLSGNRWYHQSVLREQAALFCKAAWDAACSVCDKVLLEQPKTVMQKYIGPRSQVIQPWMFGHGEVKETWLWLKGLPPLLPTDVVDGRQARIFNMPPGPERSKLRSKTYPGIARAIATQYTALLL